MMLRIPGVLSSEDILQFRNSLELAGWQDGRSTAGHQVVDSKTNQQLALNDPLAKRLGDIILDRLGACPEFIAGALPHKVLPPRFNRYAGGGHYGTHVDNALFQLGAGQGYVRTDISCTLFISDPDEYVGGELVIEDSYGDHRVKLASGDLIIYPGNSHHQVLPVSSGVRLASIFWVQSLIRSAMQRRNLFELDSAIQKLTAEDADREAVAALTGVYHNLLREWSET